MREARTLARNGVALVFMQPTPDSSARQKTRKVGKQKKNKPKSSPYASRERARCTYIPAKRRLGRCGAVRGGGRLRELHSVRREHLPGALDQIVRLLLLRVMGPTAAAHRASTTAAIQFGRAVSLRGRSAPAILLLVLRLLRVRPPSRAQRHPCSKTNNAVCFLGM